MMSNAARAARAVTVGYRLRPPMLDDAEAIGRVHLAVWRQAYVGLIDEAFLQSLTLDASIELW